MKTTWRDAHGRGQGRHRAVVARSSPRSRRWPTRARTLTPQLRIDAGETRAGAGRPGRRQQPPRRLGARAGLRAARRSRARSSTTRQRSGLSSARSQALNAEGHAARLPRPLRRRAVRDALRNGVRRRTRASPSTSTAWSSMRDSGRRRLRTRGRRRARRGSTNASSRRSSTRNSARSCRSARADRDAVMAACCARPDSSRHAHVIGAPERPATRCASSRNGRAGVRRDARRTCSAPGRHDTTTCSACATTRSARDQEYDRLLDADDPGLHAHARLSIRPTMSPRRSSRQRRAPEGRDPARAGRQRPGRDGGGVRPRRLRAVRRAHERHHRRARARSPTSRASRPAAASPTATCWARARAGPSRSCSTRGPATSSRRSSRAPIPSPSARATAAR